MSSRLVVLGVLAIALVTLVDGGWIGGTIPLTFAQAAPAVCTPGRVTPSATEGPFYKSGSPQRTSVVEPNTPGTKLVISGQVFTRLCQPVAGARLDFWQANARGAYDTAGYRLRSYQLTDGAGRYSLETVMPGQYTGRAPHVHVRVTVRNRSVLTTQLFFPGAARNQSDPLFRRELLLEVRETPGGQAATFNFVLDIE